MNNEDKKFNTVMLIGFIFSVLLVLMLVFSGLSNRKCVEYGEKQYTSYFDIGNKTVKSKMVCTDWSYDE